MRWSDFSSRTAWKATPERAQGIPRMDRAAADAGQGAVRPGDPLALDNCRRTRSSPAAPATSPGWLHRHFRYKGFRTQLGSTNGSMGYG
jgi:hypothetical protein